MSLQGWFTTFEILGGIGTLTVIIGLFLEYGYDVLEPLRFWIKTIHRFEVEVETAKAKLGAALVVMGIIIELGGSVGVIVVSDRIETAHRRELALLEKDTAWRHLTDSQRAEMKRALKPFVNRTVALERLDDPETINFTSELSVALSKAGLRVQSIEREETGDKFADGVFVIGRRTSDSELARTIVALLCNGGTGTSLMDIVPPECNQLVPVAGCELRIAVGFKPRGDFDPCRFSSSLPQNGAPP
jgi:hypothetical protein